MGKTKFQQSWKNDRPWLTSIKNDHYSAKCTACGDVLNIVSGVGAVKKPQSTLEILVLTKINYSLLLKKVL